MVGEIYQAEFFLHASKIDIQRVHSNSKYSILTFTSNSPLIKLRDHLRMSWSYDLFRVFGTFFQFGKTDFHPPNYEQGYKKET